MGSERLKVELQGVTHDLMQANGSYDAVTFKNLSAQRIADILWLVMLVLSILLPGEEWV
jgi:hypothetical protein